MKDKKEEKKRIIIPIVDILSKARKEEDANKGLEKILTFEQLNILDDLVNKTLDHEDRWLAYLWGFKASEIAEETGYTRANISARINKQIAGKKEDVTQKHKENRKKLFEARDWYLYVYLSDKEGDFRQMERYLPEKLRNDSYMYRMYQKYGGEQLEKDFIDRRHVLSEERIKNIVEELKHKPLEQVAFQERVYPENVRRIAKEHNIAIFTEEDIGKDEYTKKLYAWIKRKRELNIQYKRKQKRPKKFHESEKSTKNDK